MEIEQLASVCPSLIEWLTDHKAAGAHTDQHHIYVSKFTKENSAQQPVSSVALKPVSVPE